MGKKRLAYDLNDDHKPPNNVVIDHHHHHHHHHHHRHHNHQKPKKIKPEAKLLHTLNSHLKKLAKSRSRNMISLSSPPPPPPPPPAKVNNTHHHDHLSNSWLKHDHKEDGNYDWFMGFDSDLDDGCMGVFEFSQELCWDTTSVIGSEDNYEDLFGGNCVFSPDLIVSHNMVWVFEGDDGFGYGSYIPDPVMNTDYGDEGKFLCDMLELSSQEDMIKEFLKVNLFVS